MLKIGYFQFRRRQQVNVITNMSCLSFTTESMPRFAGRVLNEGITNQIVSSSVLADNIIDSISFCKFTMPQMLKMITRIFLSPQMALNFLKFWLSTFFSIVIALHFNLSDSKPLANCQSGILIYKTCIFKMNFLILD